MMLLDESLMIASSFYFGNCLASEGLSSNASHAHMANLVPYHLEPWNSCESESPMIQHWLILYWPDLGAIC